MIFLSDSLLLGELMFRGSLKLLKRIGNKEICIEQYAYRVVVNVILCGSVLNRTFEELN